MKADPKIVPDFEIIVCPPAESFRWCQHDYPFFGAKWHYHPEFELHLTRSTSGTMMVGDYVGGFEPGCLVLTGPNVPHNWVSDIEPGQVIRDRDMLVQFSPEWAERIARFCPELGELRPLFEDAAFGAEFIGTTALVGRKLLKQIGTARGAERVLLFLQLMTALAKNPGERRLLSQRAATCEPTLHRAKLDVATRHIMDHYAGDLSLTALAKLCGMEASVFSRFFKRHTGHTFARYVIRTRVYSACTLLTQTDQPITDICFTAGFNNVANFNRQFSKICGRTPSDYRRNAQKIGTQARQRPSRELRA